jgi:hypothetical protein
VLLAGDHVEWGAPVRGGKARGEVVVSRNPRPCSNFKLVGSYADLALHLRNHLKRYACCSIVWCSLSTWQVLWSMPWHATRMSGLRDLAAAAVGPAAVIAAAAVCQSLFYRQQQQQLAVDETRTSAAIQLTYRCFYLVFLENNLPDSIVCTVPCRRW